MIEIVIILNILIADPVEDENEEEIAETNTDRHDRQSEDKKKKKKYSHTKTFFEEVIVSIHRQWVKVYIINLVQNQWFIVEHSTCQM